MDFLTLGFGGLIGFLSAVGIEHYKNKIKKRIQKTKT